MPHPVTRSGEPKPMSTTGLVKTVIDATREGAARAAAPRLGSNGLAPGTRLREFEIVDLIGEGGFGVVYLANDHVLQRQVALKEFMPTSLAMRQEAAQIVVRPGEEVPFQLGLKSFMNEARLLAQFDHPSLVRVYQFWEDNGTAYMAMPFYRGETLRLGLKKYFRKDSAGPPDEAWLSALLGSLLEALGVLHEAKCYHRDIAPDNILLLAETGKPLLLDFGSARHVIGDSTHALTAFVKPGFAPIEQYADDASMQQGPWTDIYALGATMYFAMTGEVPVNSTSRILEDGLVPASKRLKGKYSAAFLQAIDRAMAVRPEHRLSSVTTWAALISGKGDLLEPAPAAKSGPHPNDLARPGPDDRSLDFLSIADRGAGTGPADAHLATTRDRGQTTEGRRTTAPAGRTEPGPRTDRPAQDGFFSGPARSVPQETVSRPPPPADLTRPFIPVAAELPALAAETPQPEAGLQPSRRLSSQVIARGLIGCAFLLAITAALSHYVHDSPQPEPAGAWQSAGARSQRLAPVNLPRKGTAASAGEPLQSQAAATLGASSCDELLRRAADGEELQRPALDQLERACKE